MTKNMRESLKESLSEYMSEDTVDSMMSGLIPDIEYDVDVSELEEPAQVASPDMSGFVGGLNALVSGTHNAVNDVINEFNRINGMTVSMNASVSGMGRAYGGGFSGGVKYYQRAEGGFVRSGDLVMANENGQFEMMGKFGRQPAVANNEQIVTGITRGVTTANDSVVSALNVLIGLAQRIERKELVAKVVPGSGIGRVNQQSADLFSRVTGV